MRINTPIKKTKIDLFSDSETEPQNFHVSSCKDGDGDIEHSKTSIELWRYCSSKIHNQIQFSACYWSCHKSKRRLSIKNVLRRCSFRFIYPEIEDIATVY